MSEPFPQDLTKQTNNVEQFQDTGNVLRKVNFPLDTDGNPMLTGDGSGLTNLPSNGFSLITFFGANSGINYYGIYSGADAFFFIGGGVTPLGGDFTPAGIVYAYCINGSNTYQTTDGGTTWYEQTV